MSEIINDKKVFTLQEVTLSIRKTIAERYQQSFWVKAEMNKLNHYSYSGHCYPELLEKANGKVVAQMKANLWKDDYLRINGNFIDTLREPLKDGITILFLATITFDPVHGLGLRMIDIDPVFSLGELEREKLETITRLKQEGLFSLNKELPISMLPQRIAVISVETSKGYSDFLNIISGNTWGYKFFCFLFPALLQGDRSVDSILAQLKRIRKVKEHFDIVAIIRGGGGDVGLSSYNNYALAREIAQFPIPVLTGIGHSTNETVAEMIAYKNAITPTELADYLLQKFHNFSVPVQKAREFITERSRRLLRDEKLQLWNAVKYFKSITTNSLQENNNAVRSEVNRVSRLVSFFFRREREHGLVLMKTLRKSSADFTVGKRTSLLNLERTVNIMDPVHVVRRGFTITLRNGKAVKSFTEVLPGDTLTTITADGIIVSAVVQSKKTDDDGTT